jgi:magnesium transporter
VYHRGVRQNGPLSVDDALESLSAPEALVWIELVSPTAAELDRVASELHIHPLVVEDALRPHQRPKLETYPSSALLVLKTAHRSVVPSAPDDAAARRGPSRFGELQVIVGTRFVITVRHGETNPVAEARKLLEGDDSFLSEGVSAVVYALADAVVDRYELVCDDLESAIDDIEERVFAPDATNAAERIFNEKRSTLTFIRNVVPLVEVMTRLSHTHAFFDVSPAVAPYYRDVSDHLLRVQSRLDQSRELLTAALDANLAQISIRQNEDTRAISGWAAVIAVPTLFAGIWGMNFEHMPELNTSWGYPAALATIAASSYFAYRRLKRNGWL